MISMHGRVLWQSLHILHFIHGSLCGVSVTKTTKIDGETPGLESSYIKIGLKIWNFCVKKIFSSIFKFAFESAITLTITTIAKFLIIFKIFKFSIKFWITPFADLNSLLDFNEIIWKLKYIISKLFEEIKRNLFENNFLTGDDYGRFLTCFWSAAFQSGTCCSVTCLYFTGPWCSVICLKEVK